MDKKITKAVITCGGYATRFLPITKAVPKEMLPIIDKPIIHYIMEEFSDAGIKDVLILVGRGREALLNYFDINYEVEDVLARVESGKSGAGQNLLGSPFTGMNIHYRRVPLPRGAADAVWHAKSFIGSDNFILAYCDDIYFGGNPTAELIADFNKNSNPVLTAFQVPLAETKRYGILEFRKPENALDLNIKADWIKSIIEKPQANPPSTFCASGRYLLSAEIFDLIEQDFGPREVCMTSQLNKLAASGRLRAAKTSAVRFDTGTPKGFIDANNYAFSSSSKALNKL